MEMEKAGDYALRTVGTVKLWYNIIVGVVVAVLLVVAAVGVFQYHRNWRIDSFPVTKIVCSAAEKSTTCHKGKCETTDSVTCPAVAVEGFASPFTAQYVKPSEPPNVGSQVPVYYDPADRSTAKLAHNVGDLQKHRVFIAVVLVVVAAITLLISYVQFYVRKSHLAQRVAGGVAVFDMATGRGF